MPKEDIYHWTPDVTERIRRYFRSSPTEIPLAQYPILSEQDLISYHWANHKLTLRKWNWYRIRLPRLQGAPFVVVADGEPLYVGAFYTGMSSIGCSSPVIMYDPRRTNQVIRIQRAYPTDSFGQGEDPRSDQRLKKVLQELGKLKE
jgi:hypothetical protein